MKGGFLISAIVGLDTRTTMDLDATIKGVDLTQEVLLNIFAEICEIQLEDDVTTGDKITPREIEYQLRWSEVDQNILQQAFQTTGKKHGSEWILMECKEVIEEIEGNQDLKTRWDKYRKDFEYAKELDAQLNYSSAPRLESIYSLV